MALTRDAGLSVASVDVVPVASRADLDRFIRLPAGLYADDPNWVAPLSIERRAYLDRTKNPFFRHAEAALWLALRGKRPVGRISAQVDRRAIGQFGAPVGFFGFFESEDDPAVAEALLAVAEAWLRQRGMQVARGPFSFSMNDEGGLLVDGFGTPPSLMMPHALPYYAGLLTANGYAGVKDLLAYDFRLDHDPLPASARRLVARLADDASVVIRPMRRDRYGEDVRIVLDLYNDAWAGNWGFVPLTPEEMDQLARDMKPLLRPDYAWFAEVDGEPQAFGVGVPNLNEAIADLGGSLFPFGWAKLLYRLKAGRIRSVRLPLMGVRRRLHGSPLGAALAFAIIDRLNGAFARRGFRQAELSWVLDDNLPMRRVAEAVGGRPYKTYRVFEKPLT